MNIDHVSMQECWVKTYEQLVKHYRYY